MRILDVIEEAFIAVMIFVATMLVTVNVVMRWIGLGTSWSEELTRYLLIAMTFIGMSVCARQNSHVSVDLVPMLAKGKVKLLVHGIIYILCIICSALFAWYGLELVQFSKGTMQEAPSLGFPMYWVYLIMPIGGILTTFRYSQNFIKLFTNPANVLSDSRKGNGAI